METVSSLEERKVDVTIDIEEERQEVEEGTVILTGEEELADDLETSCTAC